VASAPAAAKDLPIVVPVDSANLAASEERFGDGGAPSPVEELPTGLPVDEPAAASAPSNHSCVDCRYRRPRMVCGHPGSQFHRQTIEPTHVCPKFEASAAYGYFLAAKLGILRDEPREKMIDLLEAAVEGGLPQDDEVLARRFLASQYRLLAVENEESCLDGTLWSRAVKNLERAVKVDSEQGYGVFHDPLAIGILPPFDAHYSLVADSIAERSGGEAAIAYLEEKLSLFRGLPGDPLVVALGHLGLLYYNEQGDKQRAKRCFQSVLESEPISGREAEHQEERKRARGYLAVLAGRGKADVAILLVLAGLCCSPLAVVGMILGILALNDFKQGGDHGRHLRHLHRKEWTGETKAVISVIVGALVVLVMLFVMFSTASVHR
jgi:hypothetical protein